MLLWGKLCSSYNRIRKNEAINAFYLPESTEFLARMDLALAHIRNVITKLLSFTELTSPVQGYTT